MAFQKNFLTRIQEVEQITTVDEFYFQFDALRGLIEFTEPVIPELCYTSWFVNSLATEVDVYVEGFHPVTVLDAYCLALIFDTGYSRTIRSHQVKAISGVRNDHDVKNYVVVIPEITPACIPEVGDKHGGQLIEEPSSDISNMAIRDASMGDDEVAASGSGGTIFSDVYSIELVEEASKLAPTIVQVDAIGFDNDVTAFNVAGIVVEQDDKMEALDTIIKTSLFSDADVQGGTSVATVSSIAQGMEHLVLCVHHAISFLASLDDCAHHCWDLQRFFSVVRGCILCYDPGILNIVFYWSNNLIPLDSHAFVQMIAEAITIVLLQ